MKTHQLRLSLLVCAVLALPALAQRRPPGLPTAPTPTPRPGPTAPAAPAPREREIAPTPPAARPGEDNGARRTVTCEQARKNARFGIYFDKVDIEKLVQTVSDATCKTFILPENVRGKISIVGPENGRSEVTADEFYRAFLAALDANGLAVYQSGRYLKIVDKRSAKQNPIPLVTDGEETPAAEQMVTRIFKVQNVDLEPLRGVLQQLVSKDGDTIPYPPDTIIVNDVGSNLRRLEEIVTRLDKPSATDFVRTIQVQYASAQDVATTIQKIFEPKAGAGGRPGQARTARAPQVAQPEGGQAPAGEGGEEGLGGPVTLSQLIPDERTNKLIIVASPAAFERIEALIREIDIPISGEGRINVYYLENANAEDLAGTLQSLAQGTSNRPARPAGAPTPAGGAAAGRGQVQAAELFGGEVKISADEATNSLVIVASQSDYRNLVRVIEKLDVPRKQVFVEAVIMEVNLNRNGEFGINLHTGLSLNTPLGQTGGILGTKYASSGLPPSFSIANLASFGGFLGGLQGPAISSGLLQSLGISIPQFGIVLHALQTSSDVNVLSTPHILTSDNEEAEITVGQNVPFQAGFSPANVGGLTGLTGTGTTGGLGGLGGLGALGGLGSFFAPISRQNVELKLTVKPQINESDYIRMAINQQTEEIASNDPVLGPTTSKRSVKTVVVARDQETVVLGGIMQDRTIESVRKVPLLGDLPLLGYLFRDSSTQKVKTNLLIFLTPYIIRDQADFRRIFERKMKERQQFVEQFYGQVPGYEVPLDFSRKAGPLTKMTQAVTREQQKVENGGPGAPGERVIRPGDVSGQSPGQVSPSGQGRPLPEGTQGGQQGTPPAGGTPEGVAPNGVAPEGQEGAGGSTELRPPPEQERIQPGTSGEEQKE